MIKKIHTSTFAINIQLITIGNRIFDVFGKFPVTLNYLIKNNLNVSVGCVVISYRKSAYEFQSS